MGIAHHKIAAKWQKKWERAKIFEANIKKGKTKFFITIPFPYVNGGPHLGAGFTFLRGDAYARFKRMQGFNVLFPQGFHATGQPILGAVERLRQGDATQIETFKLYGASDKDLEDFKKFGPAFTARYWMRRWIEDLKSVGYSADWRRSFITALTPQYNRFIEWQYNTLRKKGYVIQGTHPVIWCPHCKSPTGDHDRLKGEGESPIEYILIKFKLGNKILPCGTLRPETVYGVTNIWVSPSEDYVEAEVDGENWIMSEACAEKLKDQLRKVKIVGKLRGDNLIGKEVENPVSGEKVPILPATFVDPFSASGIVMSVPAHAPYDWIGLKELQENPSQLSRYGAELKEKVKMIKPISLIKLEGYGEFPAIEICEKMGIKSLKEKEKLELATSEIYKKEFHQGILKEIIGEYSGKKVCEVKESLIKKLVEEKIADIMWETSGIVICRCTTRCHVKVLENQWFLKYSDYAWKEKVKKCISMMKFYPEEARQQFLNTVDWLTDKACTRKSGLGTPLPWDKEWIVETLSDSTIYMAFYAIARIINEKKIEAEKLTDEVFDYVFLGKGNLAEISRNSGLSKKIIEEMRKEFEYFYPVDLRTSGKDLIQHHLTFYLFHHVAIWDEKFWPRAIAVNGFVQVQGEKMSKSLGNILPLRDLVKTYGPDLVRINIISSNEGLDDANWRNETIPSFAERFEFLMKLAEEYKKAKRNKMQNIDYYIQSKMQKIINTATENFENLKFRSATQSAFFEAINEIKYYIERCNGIKNCNRNVLKYFLSVVTRLLAPLIPHICEEIWHKLGYRSFVSVAAWPKPEKKLINRKSEIAEEMVTQTLEDIKNIQKIVEKKPKKVRIIVAPSWKFSAYKKLLENKEKSFDEILKILKKDEKEYARKIFGKLKLLPEEFLSKKEQIKIFKEAKGFLEKKLGCEIIIEEAEKSKVEKAKSADVLKPAIYFD
jgi:leucyl-tRNA synthetase